MRFVRPVLAATLFSGAAALAQAGDVVVLKGGTVIALKQPVVRRGSTAYLTRADGTLLSVPVSEIDREATAAAAARQAAPPAPKPAEVASTPADAARARDGQKAKVRITDADVSHPLDLSEATPEDKEKKANGGGPSGPRVEVADYQREKTGASLVVKGKLRNPGQGTAENVRLTVTALDEKGQSVDGGNATLSKGSLDSGSTVDFTATLNVGDKNVSTLRFAPAWTTPVKPAPPAPAGAGSAAPATQGAGGSPNPPPPPVPTPYGRGTMYSAPAPSASTDVPSDSHTGYLPSVSSPDNQPKPPSR